MWINFLSTMIIDGKLKRVLGNAVSSFVMIILLLFVLPETATAQLYSPDESASTGYVCSSTQNAVRKSTDIVAVTLPVATLAGVLIMKDWEGLKEGAFTAAATLGTTYLLKAIVKERRPDGTTFASFPSGHSSTTFAAATFLQLRYGWKVGVPAYILSTYVAWGRVFAKRHHVWDAVAGAAIGAGSALFFTHPWVKKHDFRLTPVASATAIGFHTSFNF